MLYKRCNNPPCDELAPVWEPYCSPRCEKSHTSVLYHRQHFSKVRVAAKAPRAKKKRLMTDAEQEQINRAANAAITARMAQPLDAIMARRCGAMW